MSRLTFYLLMISAVLVSGCDNEEEVPRKRLKLAHVIDIFEVQGLNFNPKQEISYEYDESGLVKSYAISGYDPDLEDMVPLRSFTFSYKNGGLDRLVGTIAAQTHHYIEYIYEYGSDGSIKKIREDYVTGLDSEALFSYNEDGSVEIGYSISNGNKFGYYFEMTKGNIVRDRTTREGILCSEGEYTYDNHPNPFRTLGYIDFGLAAVSTNNKASAQVSYLACSFPESIPESYTYEYRADGYPAKLLIHYKEPSALKRHERQFSYIVD